ncbi:UNVERIFIED_CONTAM: Retrovirus-related Pol polyprotein from transposon TNT 1-94 [Sesamum calycinum]|uniref:Retrovirus-related Pol polyprotein from transposon TNT 1-94 n=1 Tax=Sesamum calycinum TaxID=2727403 RepID=A0AAW2JBU1_9LAMI
MQVKAMEHGGGQRNAFKRRGPVDKRNLICEHCHKSGNNKDTCFKINGVSDWYRDLTVHRRKPAIGRAYAVNEVQTPVDKSTAAGHNLVFDLMEALKLIQNRVPQDPVHDLRSKETMAIGHQIGKLYILDRNSFISFPHSQFSYNAVEFDCIDSDVFTLWHKRIPKLFLSAIATSTSSPRVSAPVPKLNLFPPAAQYLPPASVFDSLDSVIPDSSSDIPSPAPESVPELPTPVRRSQRVSKPPAWLDDYHCNISHTSFIPSNDLCLSHNGFFAALSTIQEPRNYLQAKGCVEWEEAMQQELAALEKNKTWDIVELPHGKKPIGCKWVYKVKLNPVGSVERYKARLVAKGYTQVEEIDYFDRFSHVAKVVTVQTFLAVASGLILPVHQVDINNAFLHGFLELTT